MANPVFTPISPHFFQPLLPGFHRHLTIPVAFYLRHIKGKQERKAVELRSDGQEGNWEVKMDGRRFADGWEEFAVAHEFKVGDMLVFRHEGDLIFHVTAFGPSCCQIQHAPCRPDDDDDDDDDDNDDDDDDDDDDDYIETSNHTFRRKKRVQKSPKTEDDSSDHTCFTAAVTVSGLRTDTLYPSISFARWNGLDNRRGEIVLMDGRGRSWTLNLRYKKVSGRVYIYQGWRDFCSANGKKAGDFFRFKLVQNGATPVLQLFPEESDKSNVNSSGESPETEEKKILFAEPSGNNKNYSGESSKTKEKETRLRRRVSSLPRQNRFVTLTLTPQSLRNSNLEIPKAFMKANGLNKPGQKITLLDGDGREWPSYLRLGSPNGRAYLGKGWRSFFAANDVKKGESFALEFIGGETTPMLKFCSKVKIEQSA